MKASKPETDAANAAPKTVPNVFIVEDEPEVFERLCKVVRQDPRLRLAGAENNLADAQRWLMDGRHRFDVLMIDLELPDGSGLDLITACKQARPEAAIMVITMFSDESHVFTALERGATGYLLKSTNSDEIGDHILELQSGGSPITPTVARLVLKRMQNGRSTSGGGAAESGESQPKLAQDLSSREIDVLNQIAVGYSTAEIAVRLNISTHTVTAHIRNVYQKLQVHSRSAAVFEGQRHGLISRKTN